MVVPLVRGGRPDAATSPAEQPFLFPADRTVPGMGNIDKGFNEQGIRPMSDTSRIEIIREHLRKSYLLSDEKIDAILPQFLQTLVSHLQDLESKVTAGELESLGKAGHKIKGALLNLGLHDLAQTAFLIEQQCRLRDRSTDYLALVEKLKREITAFL